MKISELKVGQSSVEFEGNVTDKSETRTFNKFGRDISVATATVVDESGSVKLSLWNQDIDRVNVGDKIKITNGFVKEFQGEVQVTTGKFGKLEVIGKSEGKNVEKEEKKSKPKKEETKKMDEVEEDLESEDEDFEESEDENF